MPARGHGGPVGPPRPRSPRRRNLAPSSPVAEPGHPCGTHSLRRSVRADVRPATLKYSASPPFLHRHHLPHHYLLHHYPPVLSAHGLVVSHPHTASSSSAPTCFRRRPHVPPAYGFVLGPPQLPASSPDPTRSQRRRPPTPPPGVVLCTLLLPASSLHLTRPWRPRSHTRSLCRSTRS